MATIIGLKELRENIEAIAERVSRGESFTVVKRSKPLFQINPTPTDNQALDDWLDKYVEDNHKLLESLAKK